MMERSAITSDILLRAYQCGLFPMGESRHDPTIYWIDPEQRGIIPLDRFHVPNRLQRSLRRHPFDIRVDTAFRDVIAACAEPDRGGTWINDDILELYCDLHDRGFAHSVETWLDDELVGGLYGVSIGAAFFGESMFHRVSDASKAALVHLVDRLNRGGYRLLDTQFVTGHLARFGAIEIPRQDYLRRLAEALRHRGRFYSVEESVSSAAAGGAAVRQSITEIS